MKRFGGKGVFFFFFFFLDDSLDSKGRSIRKRNVDRFVFISLQLTK